MSVAIGIAAVVFAALDVIMWSRLPLEDGDRIVAIQIWDREAGRRRDTTWQDVERWRASLQSVGDVGAFQTIRRNVITPGPAGGGAIGAVELATVPRSRPPGFGSRECRRSSAGRLPTPMQHPAPPPSS